MPVEFSLYRGDAARLLASLWPLPERLAAGTIPFAESSVSLRRQRLRYSDIQVTI